MINKIKEQFDMLSRADQLKLLRELSSSFSENNPINEVNSLNQAQYGKNIQFEIKNIGTDLSPEICAELKTAWGTFTALGENQKIAKTTAAEIALAKISEQE